jgi:hypothetical protein
MEDLAGPQQQTAKHEGTETRARSQGSNPRLNNFWFPNPMITNAEAQQQRAKETR